jgi:hypothetical protein
VSIGGWTSTVRLMKPDQVGGDRGGHDSAWVMA